MRRVTDESGNPEATEAEGEGEAAEEASEPSGPLGAREASPSTPESTGADREALVNARNSLVFPRPSLAAGAPRRDLGRTVALAILGGLVALGGLLIALGPRGGGGGASVSPPPALLSAQLAPALAPSASAPAPDAALSGSALPDDAGPVQFVPVWRVAALEHDPTIEILRGALGKRSLAEALGQAGLPKSDVLRITRSVDGIRRIGRHGANDTFAVARERTKGSLVAFEYVASPTDIWQAKSEDGLTTHKLVLFVEKRPTATALVVKTDLANAVSAAGLQHEALEQIAEALEGRGDTAVIKPGVRLRVVGHEEWVEGVFARFDVEALDYVPKSGSSLRLYYYERDSSVAGSQRRRPRAGFYDAKGKQPFQGTFRSPLQFARVTSRFNPKRMHPVLHVVKPHNGIDYRASSGTPVFASGAGTVHSAGNGGPCGNMVQIDHAGGLRTAYCHLSRFARGLHAGQHVEARQLIGYVGQTGRATGPHLHFAVKRRDKFIDPMALKMDGVRTLPPADRRAFAVLRATHDVALEAIVLPSLDGVTIDDKDDNKDEPAGEE